MKYWAEHPEAEFDVDLFEGYEKQITEEYLHANKQSRAVRSLPADKLREKSLDWYRMSKGSELKFFVAMKPALNAIDKEVSSQVLKHIDIYMTDAYKESRRRKWPTGIPPLDFYNETLEVYGLWGLSLDCLEHVLQEYRGKTVDLTAKHLVMANIIHQGESSECKEVDELQTEFDIRMFLDAFRADGGFKKLRQAVKEKIDNRTRGLSDEKCTAMCVELAKDDMLKVNQFTRWVYNKTYPMEETSDGKFVPLITPEERHWLQNIMYDNSPGATGRQKLTLMGRYFSYFISILEDIGRIWAAQLLVHGTDMKQLEEEKGIILSKLPDTMYYVDGLPNDRRGDCCVIDMREAEELLHQIRGKAPHVAKQITWEDKKQCFKTAVLNVMERKKPDGNYLLELGSQWIAIYRFAVDNVIMYEQNKQSVPEGNSPQYKTFSDFAHEHQLDVNPPTRLPFKKEYISKISKPSYRRYNSTYPWPHDGIMDARSFEIYTQLEDVYMALKEEYENLVHQKEQETN